MRQLTDHRINPFNRNHVDVNATDGSGPGGASHEYVIDLLASPDRGNEPGLTGASSHYKISFQNGPVKEAGINGIPDEALYAILIDRLRGFQGGKYSCRENAVALTKIEESLMWLHKRTLNREARSVEGTSAV